MPLLGPQWASTVCPASTSGALELFVEGPRLSAESDGGVAVYLEDILLKRETPAEAVAPLLLLVVHHALERAIEELLAVDAFTETCTTATDSMFPQSPSMELNGVPKGGLRLTYKSKTFSGRYFLCISDCLLSC